MRMVWKSITTHSDFSTPEEIACPSRKLSVQHLVKQQNRHQEEKPSVQGRGKKSLTFDPNKLFISPSQGIEIHHEKPSVYRDGGRRKETDNKKRFSHRVNFFDTFRRPSPSYKIGAHNKALSTGKGEEETGRRNPSCPAQPSPAQHTKDDFFDHPLS